MILPIILLSVAVVALSVTCIVQEFKIKDLAKFVIRWWESQNL